jgi:hypothetical protein
MYDRIHIVICFGSKIWSNRVIKIGKINYKGEK